MVLDVRLCFLLRAPLTSSVCSLARPQEAEERGGWKVAVLEIVLATRYSPAAQTSRSVPPTAHYARHHVVCSSLLQGLGTCMVSRQKEEAHASLAAASDLQFPLREAWQKVDPIDIWFFFSRFFKESLLTIVAIILRKPKQVLRPWCCYLFWALDSAPCLLRPWLRMHHFRSCSKQSGTLGCSLRSDLPRRNVEFMTRLMLTW